MPWSTRFFRPPEIWGIPTNEHGVVVGVAERFAAKRYEPTRDQVAADLAQWLEWVRTRPADGVKLRADIEKAYVFLDDTAKRKLNEYNKRFDPFAVYNTPDKLAKKTVTMTFPKVLPIEGQQLPCDLDGNGLGVRPGHALLTPCPRRSLHHQQARRTRR